MINTDLLIICLIGLGYALIALQVNRVRLNKLQSQYNELRQEASELLTPEPRPLTFDGRNYHNRDLWLKVVHRDASGVIVDSYHFRLDPQHTIEVRETP